MNILVVGSGGREHALAWKIAKSPLLTRLVCAPGNPGMASVGDVCAVKANDVIGMISLAREIDADLVVIGPETAVEAGLADGLAAAGIPCFGPTAAAGRLESSKAFTKAFADRHGIPTARYRVFDLAAPAKRSLDSFSPPFVIKADGLAAGKGVVIAATRAEAEAAIEDALGGRFGEAGARVVIEEYLEGEIASLFALCDGETVILFGGAQDHKRAFDGEVGPNTGGMGAYAPAPILSEATVEAIRADLIVPALAGIAAEGAPYRGVLFCETMVTSDGPKLIEFNARFGDPECQVLMLRLESDLVPYLMACATGRLAELAPPVWRDEVAICVVLAAKGYPGVPEVGAAITLPDGDDAGVLDDVTIFQAGTTVGPGGVLTATGGRVLNVCAVGATLTEARDRAYAAIDAIGWPHGFCRRDIGWRALAR